MPIAGHGYRVSPEVYFFWPQGESSAAPTVAAEPASAARRGPTIGCDAPSAVARSGQSREGDYVVCRGSALWSRVVEGPAGGNLRSFRCYGGSCLPASGHFGQLCQLSGTPASSVYFWISRRTTAHHTHVAAPSEPLPPLLCTLTGCLFTLYTEYATMPIEWQPSQARLVVPAIVTDVRRPNLALGILPLHRLRPFWGEYSCRAAWSLRRYHGANKRQACVVVECGAYLLGRVMQSGFFDSVN